MIHNLSFRWKKWTRWYLCLDSLAALGDGEVQIKTANFTSVVGNEGLQFVVASNLKQFIPNLPPLVQSRESYCRTAASVEKTLIYTYI